MNNLAQEFVDLILKRNPNCNTKCGVNLLYEYYTKRPGIIYAKNDLTDRQKCLIIINRRDEMLLKMNEIVLPEYFF